MSSADTDDLIVGYCWQWFADQGGGLHKKLRNGPVGMSAPSEQFFKVIHDEMVCLLWCAIVWAVWIALGDDSARRERVRSRLNSMLAAELGASAQADAMRRQMFGARRDYGRWLGSHSGDSGPRDAGGIGGVFLSRVQTDGGAALRFEAENWFWSNTVALARLIEKARRA